MKNKLLNLLAFAYENFAPLIVFFVTEQLAGFREAIAATLIISCVDFAWRRLRRHSLTRLYYLSLATTVAFGIIDLYATNPFIFQYEAVLTNLLTAAFFGMTLFRGTPLIQEVAQKTLSPERAADPQTREYLRILTGVWTLYFVLKAVVYFYFAANYSIAKAMALRSAVGTISLCVLLFGERLFRKPLFRFLRNRGWLAPSRKVPDTFRD